MKKNLLIIALGIIVIFVAASFILNSSVNSPKTKEIIKNDDNNFQFIFKYGVGAKNELNTYDGTFTKDMVTDPSITIPMKLTENELSSISQKIKELDVLEKKSNNNFFGKKNPMF